MPLRRSVQGRNTVQREDPLVGNGGTLALRRQRLRQVRELRFHIRQGHKQRIRHHRRQGSKGLCAAARPHHRHRQDTVHIAGRRDLHARIHRLQPSPCHCGTLLGKRQRQDKPALQHGTGFYLSHTDLQRRRRNIQRKTRPRELQRTHEGSADGRNHDNNRRRH